MYCDTAYKLEVHWSFKKNYKHWFQAFLTYIEHGIPCDIKQRWTHMQKGETKYHQNVQIVLSSETTCILRL